MKPLPITDKFLVIRTDFSDDAAWAAVCDAVRKSSGRDFEESATHYMAFVSDPAFDGLTVEQLLPLVRKEEYRKVIFLVDGVTLTDPEMPVLAVDVHQKPGKTFRVVPRETYHIEDSWLANMDFRYVASLAEADGVFRMETPQSYSTPEEEAAAGRILGVFDSLARQLGDEKVNAALDVLAKKLADHQAKGK